MIGIKLARVRQPPEWQRGIPEEDVERLNRSAVWLVRALRREVAHGRGFVAAVMVRLVMDIVQRIRSMLSGAQRSPTSGECAGRRRAGLPVCSTASAADEAGWNLSRRWQLPGRIRS